VVACDRGAFVHGWPYWHKEHTADMSLRPLGHRIIVKPEPAASQSLGGLYIPETAGQPPAMSGTVIAVADGPARAHKVRERVVKDLSKLVTETYERISPRLSFAWSAETLALAIGVAFNDYLQARAGLSEVNVGDFVCFAYTVGSTIVVDGEECIVLAEDDISAVWAPETVS
jgi:co-chaperonin GroES (HSP10)